MKLVIFGLTVSSSWGNGHATLWRGLCKALVRRGHDVVFFERDVPYYASHRDLTELPGATLVLYSEFAQVLPQAREHLTDADVGIVTSYCPDALASEALLLGAARPLRVFYDLDTPVTLAQLHARGGVDYLGERGLRDYDLALSFTGGRALDALACVLGARRTAVLYGSVDPSVHGPTARLPRFVCDLSYLGTYAEDRQDALERLFIAPARAATQRVFSIGGAQYPESFPWTPNMLFVRHLPPSEHSAFYASSRFTLNVTRRAMAQMGFCPSGRLFEAAACGAPIVSDEWEGLAEFFVPGSEIVVARTTRDVLDALDMDERERARIALAARERALSEHTADARVQELEQVLERVHAEARGGRMRSGPDHGRARAEV
jgi:spore maturation protein CgeB